MTVETKIVGRLGGGRWVMMNEGMGEFLNPPGDAEHDWSVAEYRGSRSSYYATRMSLRSALESEWVPASVRTAARQKLAAGKPECTEKWLKKVYTHFHSCYSPDGVDGHLDELPPAESHLAVLAVRKFFPDHEPRTDLIEAS